jgi:orotidine-5'-phosphate decarboxylase
MSSKIFCAIDTPDLSVATSLADRLQGYVAGLKMGLEFYSANGPEGIKALQQKKMPVFLDLKLHDIPNTVANAIAALLPLTPQFVTVHAHGGSAMMKAAHDAARKGGDKQPKLLAVTVLTSLDGEDLKAVGVNSGNTTEQVVRLAKLARDCGMDGVVCAPTEIVPLRQELGKDFILMVPGIRPQSAAANDQKRVMTPKEAVAAGATYLVVGRPITQKLDPAAAALAINAEVM